MLDRSVRALVAAGSIAFALYVALQTRTDVDLWGHIRFGLDIVDSGALPEVDPYSFTSDRPWINHEWLSEIIFALAWQAAGTPGLVLVKLACTFGALGLIASVLRQRHIEGHPRTILLGLTLLGILPRVAQVRPQLFSVLLFAALLRVFTGTDRGNTRALLWTVPIMILWANTHGGWLVGVGTVALWSAGEAWALRARPGSAALALACGIAAGAGTLVNPYGIGLWRFLLETVRFGRNAIREWGPAWTDPATSLVWLVFVLLLIGALKRASRPRNPSTALIPIAWGIASLRVGRLDAFFALATVGLLAAPASLLFAARGSRREELPFRWKLGAAAAALVLLLILPVSRQSFTCIGFLAPRWPEPEAVEFIQQNRLSGRVVTYFDWGEYAIWHVAPALKVSMDGRRETVYSDRTIANHLQLYAGTADGLAYLKELKPDFLWVPRSLPVVAVLRQQGWTGIFDGSQSSLLVPFDVKKTGAQFSVPIAPRPRTRCFPGP